MCGTTEIPTEKRKRAAQLSSLRPVRNNMSGYLGSGHPWRFPRFSLGARKLSTQIAKVAKRCPFNIEKWFNVPAGFDDKLLKCCDWRDTKGNT